MAWFEKLAGKIFLISLMAIFVATAMSTAWRYWDESRTLESSALDDLNQFLLAIQPSLVRSSWQLNKDSMEVLLFGVLSQKGVVAVRYADVTLDLVAGDNNRFNSPVPQCSRVVERDYSSFRVQNQPLGFSQMLICLDDTQLGGVSLSSILAQMLPLLLGVLSAALVISIAINWLLIDPLRRLSTHIAGKFPIDEFQRFRSLTPANNDELDQLIDELKRRTRQLNQERSIVDMSLPEARDMIVQTDLDFNVLRSNSVFETMIDSESKDACLSDYFNSDILTQIGLHDSVPGPKNRRYELRTVRFGDEDDGGYLYIIRDLTEQIEKQARAVHEGKMSALGTLSSGVAHDFNNILAGIMGNVELILFERQLSREAREKLEAIVEFSQRGASLSNQLLSFARRKHQSKTVFSAHEVLEKVSVLAGPLIGNSIQFKTLSSCKKMIDVDRGLLEAALMNLIVNARDAVGNTPKAKITISCENTLQDDEHYVCFTVKDNGHGMTEEVIEKIREPFFTTKGRGKGSGLGLAMISGFAAQSNGSLQISSIPEIGTMMMLSIPVASTERVEKAANFISQNHAVPEQTTGGKSILIIEDEAVLLSNTAALLRHDGYRVTTVGSLLEIEERGLADYTFDLVLSDVVLENCTAVDILQHFKNAGNRSPFALVSGNFSNDFFEQVREFGELPMLEKPYRGRDLKAFVARCIHIADSSAGRRLDNVVWAEFP